MEAEEEEDDSDEINVQSEKFNALQALYSNKVVVPFPSAPVLDNVAKATSLLSRNQDLINKPIQKIKIKKEEEESASTSSTTATGDGSAGPGNAPPAPPKKNVLTRMEETKGPLGFLKACMEKRIRVKVWTRTARGIRGYCLGFVVAFDKHWNLVLEDVREVWTRRNKRKKYHMGKPNEMPLAWRAMGPAVRPPEVVVTQRGPGVSTCERHVNQMLMRGLEIFVIKSAVPIHDTKRLLQEQVLVDELINKVPVADSKRSRKCFWYWFWVAAAKVSWM